MYLLSVLVPRRGQVVLDMYAEKLAFMNTDCDRDFKTCTRPNPLLKGTLLKSVISQGVWPFPHSSHFTCINTFHYKVGALFTSIVI